MKAIKTIVATAVIVFALTTVAMAGVHRLGSDTGQGGAAQAQPAGATAAGQAGDTVTLSAQQFAALLHAVDGNGARDRTQKARHRQDASRTHRQDKSRTHAGSHATSRAGSHTVAHPAQGGQGGSGAGDGETHVATQHTATQTHAQTHDGAAHESGSHGDGHDGGCD